MARFDVHELYAHLTSCWNFDVGIWRTNIANKQELIYLVPFTWNTEKHHNLNIHITDKFNSNANLKFKAVFTCAQETKNYRVCAWFNSTHSA